MQWEESEVWRVSYISNGVRDFRDYVSNFYVTKKNAGPFDFVHFLMKKKCLTIQTHNPNFHYRGNKIGAPLIRRASR